jgi:DNA-binding IclR family transcriptional regulator
MVRPRIYNRTEIMSLLMTGLTVREVARRTGAGKSTVHRIAQDMSDREKVSRGLVSVADGEEVVP